jgi:competence protein ComEC
MLHSITFRKYLPNIFLVLLVVGSIVKGLVLRGPTISVKAGYQDWYYNLLCHDVNIVAYSQDIRCADMANLFSGLVLGIGNFTSEFKTSFKSLGLVHLIVASGTQVVYLYDALEWILVNLGVVRKLRWLVLCVACASMIAIIGPSAPIIRAVLCTVISLGILIFLGRWVHPLRMLVLVGCGMVLFSSGWLYSLSFWLSMLASTSLVLSNMIKAKHLPQIMQDNIIITVMLLPILSQFSSSLNLLSLLINMVVIGWIPWLLLVIIAINIPWVGVWIGHVAYYLVYDFIQLLFWLDGVTPWLKIEIKKFNNWDMTVYYLGVFIIFMILYIRRCRLDRFDLIESV